MYISPQNECILEETLMNLNICLFLIKDDALEKYSEIWEKVKNNLIVKKKLLVNQYTVKNIQKLK